ncbi:hypothetical protein MMC25_002733 [Agyrium rufum]|nr:hypothetical protein [Agyrium rufum]
MGKIKKSAGPKHEATLSPSLAEFVKVGISISPAELPNHLRSFPRRWPFPRGDLYHWIPLLDRFDTILEQFIQHYGLSGPQRVPFNQKLIEDALKEKATGSEVDLDVKKTLATLGYGPEGDRELVESLLGFSTLLLENCGNRSLYSSSDRIAGLLNTTSLNLLCKALRLAVRLAQRYAASRQRLNISILASHFNIKLDVVQKLANPFPKPPPAKRGPPMNSLQTNKGKGKSRSNSSTAISDEVVSSSDLLAICKNDQADHHKNSMDRRTGQNQWKEWGNVAYSFYKSGSPQHQPNGSAIPLRDAPSTPTPIRRTSNLSRPIRLSDSDDASGPGRSISKSEDSTTDSAVNLIELSSQVICSTPLDQLMASHSEGLSMESQFDFLCRLRVAYGLSCSLETRRQIVAVRVLALTCLAYLYHENEFQQKIAQEDQNEPRRLQLPYQLADLIHPPGNRQSGVPLELKTYAIGALEAFLKHKSKASDVCSALNVNVNHGVLLFVLRKAAADLAIEDTDHDLQDKDDWREALVSLLELLPQAGGRTGESLVAAGLVDILIEMLSLRTHKAERYHYKILTFLNNHLYQIRDAFTSFTSLKGLEALSDLIAFEVTNCLEHVARGEGFPVEHRNQVLDYKVPFFQQQTLRWAFKVINHMMTTGSANTDRSMRNLVDTPLLLQALLSIITHASDFGSNVWSGGVSILSSFIHNEPTCYAVVAEAGLVRGFLQNVSGRQMVTRDNVPKPAISSDADMDRTPSAASHEESKTLQSLSAWPKSTEVPLEQCILPATDAMMSVPHAFGAICLNNAGLDLFLDSGALETFFTIFLSQPHVKALAGDMEYPRLLGRSFDELVRHHPRLKSAVIDGILNTLNQLQEVCSKPIDTTASTSQFSRALQSTDASYTSSLPNGEEVEMGDATPNPTSLPSSISKQPAFTTYLSVIIRFLAGFLENSSISSKFLESGGIQPLMKLLTLPSAPQDLGDHDLAHEITEIFQKLIISKPHLVMPAIVQYMEAALEVLKPFSLHQSGSPFFADYISELDASVKQSSHNLDTVVMQQGSDMIQAMIQIHLFCTILNEVFTSASFVQRQSPTVFTQLNLTDRYAKIVQHLGDLQIACTWEEILFEEKVTDPTSLNSLAYNPDAVDPVSQALNSKIIAHDTRLNYLRDGFPHGVRGTDNRALVDVLRDVTLPELKDRVTNYEQLSKLRYVLGNTPVSLMHFSASLGKALLPKRRLDSYQRQAAQTIADALADTLLRMLTHKKSADNVSKKDRYGYLHFILECVCYVLVEGAMDRPHPQCLTLVLQSLFNHGGLTEMKDLLEAFLEEVSTKKLDPKNEDHTEAVILGSSYGCVQVMLPFLSHITSAKCIAESSQSQSMISIDRDRERDLVFTPGRFLVEIRATILPLMRSVWDSDFMEKSSSESLKPLIEILKSVLDAEQEHGARHRSDKKTTRTKPTKKKFNVNFEKFNTLCQKGYEEALVREALYRCHNSRDFAEEYCKFHQQHPDILLRLPVPVDDVNSPILVPPNPSGPGQSAAPVSDAEANDSNPPAPDALAENADDELISVADETVMPAPPTTMPSMDLANAWNSDGDDSAEDTTDDNEVAMNIDNVLSIANLLNQTAAVNGSSSRERSTPAQADATPAATTTPVEESEEQSNVPTVEDLDEERALLRSNLIDRVLDILNAHSSLTFELADLLIIGSAKAPQADMRKDIGSSLLQALMSFQSEEDYRAEGSKIAAVANLLAIVIQEKGFFDSIIDELKDEDMLAALFDYVKVLPDVGGPSDPSLPWIPQVLLVAEKLLAEDVQPQQIRWTPPNSSSPTSEDSIVEMDAPLVSQSQKIKLFDDLIALLPRIGKDSALGLSVMRILVILTRNREIAQKLSEKSNLQRLFPMVKQLTCFYDTKLKSAFMQVLRHIIEDDETIRRVMRSEIVANFDSRSTRPTTDTTAYVRNMNHLVLRAPALFVEVTNEKLKLARFDPGQRPQTLMLKHEAVPPPPPIAATDGESSSTAAISTEQGKAADSPTDAWRPQELKAPVVESPDGVVHHILSQLLSFKDIDDKELEVPPKSETELSTEPTIESGSSTPVSQPIASSPAADSDKGTDSAGEKKLMWSDYKPENHPITVYRWFLLESLSELLASYNRCKVEFINFSRKADPKSMTPSKPRSGILSYLLNALIPLQPLSTEETLANKKASITAEWAMTTIIALSLRTPENGYPPRHAPPTEDQDVDLLFVRKFALEHALKAFRDTASSPDPLNSKYGRLLSFAEFFSKLLTSKMLPGQSNNGSANNLIKSTQMSIAKIMFEKNFINAFTGAIADIDLNYPESKRVIKAILKPLQTLTRTAIYLSQTSAIQTSPDQTDGDEISATSSVSEMEGEEREETPDLFRHSTLGMLEPGREEESTSESSDEDEAMYDDEYDDGMEYEEENGPDGDEVVSDEDEDLEGAGPIEGLSGDINMNVEVLIDDGDEDDEDDDDDDDDDGEDDDDNDPDDSGMDEDHGEDIEIVDELNGDDENASLADGEEEEWEDDEGDVNTDPEDDMDEHHVVDAAEAHHDEDGLTVQDIVDQIPDRMDHFAQQQALEDRNRLRLDEYVADLAEVQGTGEDDDEDDVEQLIEEEVVYSPGLENEDDEDAEAENPHWAWGTMDEDPMGAPVRRHRWHPTSIRGARDMHSWSMFPPGHAHSHRSHRPTGMPRGVTDGVNPLLQRADRVPTLPGAESINFPSSVASMADFIHTMESMSNRNAPLSIINTFVGGAPGRRGPGFGAIGLPEGQFSIQIGANGPPIPLPRDLQTALFRRPPMPDISRVSRDASPSLPASPLSFPATVTRWEEEARLLFGLSFHEKTQRVINSLLQVLVPPALEEEQAKKRKAEEDQKKAEEAMAKAVAEERLQREKEEQEAKEKKEREDREAQEQAAQAAAQAEEGADPNAMEGVESTSRESDTTAVVEETQVEEPAASAPTERVVATFRGREVDITSLGIDLEYLNALPEELREEVLMGQLAQQRSDARDAGQEPTDINQEFLEALPPEIREELLQQERQDRRRRERDAANRTRVTAGGGTAVGPADGMDTADFLATLDPQLRTAILAETEDEVLATLPPAIRNEARALINRHPTQGMGDSLSMLRRARQRNQYSPTGQATDGTTKKPPRRQIVQMLDKAGVATLLRLLFIPQQAHRQSALHEILINVSTNRQNRAEVIGLLLSVLQDGSADVNAVERGFHALSLRAKNSTSQKTPQSIKRTQSGAIVSVNRPEMTPLMVIQQCLIALVTITEHNTQQIPPFFLTEHDTPSAMRTKSNKKGKGKESRASKFALNSLLGLLDRDLIMESSTCMEQLSTLLQAITHHLTIMARRDKEEADAGKATKDAVPAETVQEGEVTRPTTAATDGTDDASMAETEQSTAPDELNPLGIVTEATTTDQSDVNALERMDTSTSTKLVVDDQEKKPRSFALPIVPDENLRLVIRILTARECNSKTFRDTLSTINNLLLLPGSKEVFSDELLRQAQELGQSILHDLDELTKQVNSADRSTEVQGIALSRFSPSSSDQAKLLRVLTALDYLFDPKRAEAKQRTGDTEAAPPIELPKDNMLASIYEDSTFGPLWTKLSDCLTAIRKRDNMQNIPTILQPLIEALMVVCKNTTIKEQPLSKAIKDFAVSSPPPESRIENLFFKFTEEHRKILNDLVRQNPRLMSGTFSVLVQNPKVLEFDNKRNYFTRRLHTRSPDVQRQPQPPLQLSVRRDQVLLDSFKSLHYKSADEMKYGKLGIRFHGEEGVDAGGVTREWFQVMSRQMFDPNYALFVPVASDRTTFHPNRLSHVNPEHLTFFNFIGRVIGKALYEGRALDCHFSRAVYKRILGKPVSIKDMETLDLDYYKSLLWMLENDIQDIITETFSIEIEAFGETQIVDLVENGRNIAVSDDNKQEYVQLVVEYRLTGSVQAQLEEFLKGFHDIVPAELIAIFDEQELELLISGLPDIDVDDWKNNTDYHNYQASSAQIQWFWRAVRSFDKEERAKLLQFVTGTSKVPLNGFKELEGMNGFSKFNIHRDYGNKDRLPSSHTCFNQLDLPEYESYENLRKQVYTAMTAGSEYFGFA